MDNRSDKGNRKNLEMCDVESTDDSRRDQPSILGTPRTESISTEWTDEKHSLYLQSMETSFVNELYKSENFISSQSQNHLKNNIQLGKFKVLRRGCWRRIDFEGGKPFLSRPLKKRFGNQDVLGNPWIEHFRSSKFQLFETSPICKENKARISDRVLNQRRGISDYSNPSTSLSKQSYIGCSNCSSGTNIDEVSDQNFVEEDVEEVNAGKSLLDANGMTIEVNDASNDQVVPTSKESRGEDDRIELFSEDTG